MKEKEKKINKKLLGLNITAQIVLMIFGVIFLVLSTYAFLFFLFAMIPTIVTMMVDYRPGRYASSTIAAFNFIAIIPFFMSMASSGDFNATAQDVLVNMNTWYYVYGVTSIGCLLIWSIPQIVSLFYIVKMRSKVTKLKEEQDLLIEKWGENLRKF